MDQAMTKKNQDRFPCKLERPLAVFDIEATGINVRTDRIIDLSIVKLMPDGSRVNHEFRINPGMPIPPASTAVHGITDADVKDAPMFAAVAQNILDAFKDCDLGGYNLIRFDIPMLEEEFIRAGLKFEMEGRNIIDAQRIYHKREPRDLTAALAFYCNEMHLGAHGAVADVLATIRVLEGQLERYSDLPRDIQQLAEYCNPRDPDWLDSRGLLRWADGEILLNFSRKKDTPLKVIIKQDPSFVKWIMRGDFPRDVKEIIQNAVEGRWPEPPARPAQAPSPEA